MYKSVFTIVLMKNIYFNPSNKCLTKSSVFQINPQSIHLPMKTQIVANRGTS